MKKVLEYGNVNKNGEIKSMEWEQDGLICDLMRDCFFYSSYVESSEWEKTVGFCKLGDCDDVITECFSEHTSYLYVKFLGYNYIDDKMLNTFIGYIDKYCEDEENVTILLEITNIKGRKEDYEPKLTMYFYTRE